MTRPTWTPQRRLLRDLMEAFFDVPPRRTSVARITSRGPEPGSRPVEPAAKLEHHDEAKLVSATDKLRKVVAPPVPQVTRLPP